MIPLIDHPQITTKNIDERLEYLEKIKTIVKEVPSKALIGLEKFHVLSPGTKIYKTSIKYSKNIRTYEITPKTYIELSHTWFVCNLTSDSKYSLKDMNVILNTYNDWYIFLSYRDAQEYLNGGADMVLTGNGKKKVDYLTITKEVIGG